MRRGLVVLGVIVELIGWLWIGQGTGLVRWPASSFMIDQSIWIWAGVAMVLFGGVLTYLGVRPRR